MYTYITSYIHTFDLARSFPPRWYIEARRLDFSGPGSHRQQCCRGGSNWGRGTTQNTPTPTFRHLLDCARDHRRDPLRLSRCRPLAGRCWPCRPPLRRSEVHTTQVHTTSFVSAEFGGWPWVVLMILRLSIRCHIVCVGQYCSAGPASPHGPTDRECSCFNGCCYH